MLGLILYQLRLMWPYWLIGVIAGAVLSEATRGKALIHFMSQVDRKAPSRVAMILAGALLGAASPLCLFGAIPILGALHACGIPTSAIIAFLVSSPLINPNLFIFSFALGVPLAIARLICAILMGVIAGILVEFTRAGNLLLDLTLSWRAGSRSERKACHVHSHKYDEGGNRDGRHLLRSMMSTAGFTGKYMLLGTALAAVVHLSFPRTLLLRTLGPENRFAVLVAASAGIPLYVCGGGTIPLVRDLLWLGMAPGAALAFLLSGPATKMTNLTALGAILGKRNLALYVAFNILGAIVLGYLYNLLIR